MSKLRVVQVAPIDGSMEQNNKNIKGTKSSPAKSQDDVTRKSIFTEFAETTTAHGFSNIVLTGALSIKIIWIFVIIGCQTCLVFQVIPLVTTYLNKPVSQTLTMKQFENLTFPVVTICNSNMVKFSMYYNLSFDANETSSSEYDSSETEMETDSEFLATSIRDDTFRKEMAILALSEGERISKYGHTFDDMVMKCKWKKIYNCKKRKFWRHFWHWRYGNCFSFNTGKIPRQVTKAGVYEGLSLKINLQEDEFLSNTESAGLLLHVGEKGRYIDLESDGYNISPGSVYSAIIHQTRMRRVDPFNNLSCIPHYSTDLGEFPNGIRDVNKYSTELCFKVCASEEMIRQCNCTSYTVPSLSSLNICNSSHETQCANEIQKAVTNKSLTCAKDCRLPCEHMSFTLDITGSRYSKQALQEADTLSINMNFKNFESLDIEENVPYKIENLLSDIGGQLGLWSGFSVVTCLEVIFLFVHAFDAFLKKCRLYFKEKNKNEASKK